MRLRRSDPGRPGYGRRRRGKGWLFVDAKGEPVRDPGELARLRDLVIPPAWRDVWISPYPNGHIQATGIDAAGRKQYLYHPLWRQKRDEAKFDHVLEVAHRLPVLRGRVENDLTLRGLRRDRVLATVTRLLDMGMFRVGSDQYATGDDPTFGVATLRPEHARSRAGCVVFEFPAKGGIEQVRRIADPELCRVLANLRRRRRTQERLFGYWDGRAWRDVRSDEINDYLRDASGGEMTAKDFRTWHATVLAATELATAGRQRSATARKRAVAAVMRSVAELLGNTPTVARTSYVDPRVVDLYHDGVLAAVEPEMPRESVEKAVLVLLEEETT
ncbi:MULTISPECIES: DNA topoisomerase IB [Micromonospora]|uniref:DNA topoisomerase n=1 Tax=Micromonospora solifontis TaxID=2487138 RepID=A0ABX9W8I5_9ACTN|nr:MULTISPECIES: DNA topoisomerase IB [Micromonospora]NES13378.1 DNA topoisomerase IB [Micromonospora sp. PPF5-17B]NES39651.1 DNA topoisomerase IB [Micromonospora solifontis]NES55606.1 DNA topoisomerase IB [Micromonospora sp. PPF5-6]RNL87784.1 DNA topoisomerase IB [Micromonospora solifontis]